MRHIFSFFIIIFVVVVICKRIGNVKSHVKRCQISKLTNQFVQRVNCNAVTVNVSRKNCSVMTNQTVKTNQMKMPAVSSLIWSIQMPWSNFVRFWDWFSFCSFRAFVSIIAVDLDPNRAPECDTNQCTIPDCFCSSDGTRIPGNIEPSQVPQMITLTFNGAVNIDNIDLYEEIFNGQRQNPNGCQIKGTFFVSHKYSNYSAVQDLHRKGHEISSFSLTHKDDPNYWTHGTYDDWLAEMAGARLILERFANITDSSVVGVRAPYLRVGGNKQFEMMADQFFIYDASITASLGRVPIWPYTLYFRMPHKCNGNAHNCPSRSHPIWEMVMNELDRRDDPNFDESLPGCHMVDSCSNIQTGEQFSRLLHHNFYR